MKALFLLLMALSLISLNVNGLRDANKRAGLLQFLRCLSSPPDVVCLQEVHTYIHTYIHFIDAP